MIFLRRIIIYLLSLLIINLPTPQSANAGKINNLINRICLRNFNLETKKSKTSFSSETGTEICKCFVRKLQKGSSFKQSKLICIEKILKNTNNKEPIG